MNLILKHLYAYVYVASSHYSQRRCSNSQRHLASDPVHTKVELSGRAAEMPFRLYCVHQSDLQWLQLEFGYVAWRQTLECRSKRRIEVSEGKAQLNMTEKTNLTIKLLDSAHKLSFWTTYLLSMKAEKQQGYQGYQAQPHYTVQVILNYKDHQQFIVFLKSIHYTVLSRLANTPPRKYTLSFKSPKAQSQWQTLIGKVVLLFLVSEVRKDHQRCFTFPT